MADDAINTDFNGLSMSISASELAKAILPEIIRQLSTNTTFQQAIATAIMPSMRTAMLQLARTTTGKGTVTGSKG